MTAQRGFKMSVILAVAGGVALTCLQLVAAEIAQPPVPAGQAQTQAPEVQLRGPVHEAFAEQYNADPTPGVIVPKKPPEEIDEIPPEQMPDGENVVWIPGYWGWDDEAENYLWVSGLWRVIPEGQRWVPGYWTQVEGGYQWTSGFWTAAETAELSYQPAPPESVESGPNVAAPSDDYFWVPGCWMYDSYNYRWRPGYWSVCYEDWVWIPQRYVWTPRGCIFVNGYWDYRLPRRGVLFAPLYFSHGYYPGRYYRYSPTVVVALDHLLIHLFLRPRYGHYYFGDYYDDRYARLGFFPWYSYHNHRRRYDPVFAYYRWHYGRRGTDIAGRMRGWHDYFRRHKDFRPPRTLSAQASFVKHHSGDRYASNAVLSRRLDEHIRRSDTGQSFHRLDDSHRRNWTQAISRQRDLQKTRLKIERSGLAKADSHGGPGHGSAGRSSTRLKLPDQAEFRRPTRSSSAGRRVGSSSHRIGAPATSRSIPDFTSRHQSGSSGMSRGQIGSGSSPRTHGNSSFPRAQDSGSPPSHGIAPSTSTPRVRDSGHGGSSRPSFRNTGPSRSGSPGPSRGRSHSGSASTSPSRSHESKSRGVQRESSPGVIRAQNADEPSFMRREIARPSTSTPQRSTTRTERARPTASESSRPNFSRPSFSAPKSSHSSFSHSKSTSSKASRPSLARPSFSAPKSSHSSSSRPSFSHSKSSRSSSSRPSFSRPSFSRSHSARSSSSRPSFSRPSSSSSQRSISRSRSSSSRQSSHRSSGSSSHSRKSGSSSRRSRGK